MSRLWKRLLIGLLLGVAFFALIGFLVLPSLLLRVATQQLERHATLPGHIERIEVNPFTLELTVHGFTLGAPESPELSVQRLYADLAWDSLWRGALHVQRALVEQPRTRLVLGQTGTLNAAHWFSTQPSEPATDDTKQPFPLVVDSLTLSEGDVRFRDEHASEPIVLAYEGLTLEVTQLSTLPDQDAEAVLSAQGPAGSTLQWKGTLGLAPVRSAGQVAIRQLPLPTFAAYLHPFSQLSLEQGVLDAEAHYRLMATPAFNLTLSQGQARLQGLQLAQVGGEPLLQMTRLSLNDARLNLAKRQLAIGSVHSTGLEGWVTREADGQLNWQAALVGQTRDKPAPASAPKAQQAWQVSVSEVRLEEQLLHLTDRVPEEPVTLQVGPLAGQLHGYDSRGSTPVAVQLETAVGLHGQLKAEGEVRLAPVSAALEVQASDLDMRLAQSYLTPYLHLELRSGLLGGDLQVALRRLQPLDFAVTGRAQVTQLHTLDTVKNRDLVRWRELQVEGLTYEHNQRVALAKVHLDQPYARFVIYPDLTTSLGDLLVKRQPTTAPAAPAALHPAGQPLAVHVGEVTLSDGSAHFADLSLQPNFVTDIQQLQGKVSAIDNRSKSPATLAFSGKVDRYAPVSIEGTLDPFDPLERLDVAARFQNLELTTLTPYAAKFAGYRIRKGRMNLALQYRISDSRLQADHNIVIEELQLGERVESPKAVNLPVRLAVALLKDSSGTIKLDIPVQGDLANPEFKVMPLVWKSLRNLIAKAAKSPFNFIGSLVGAGDSDLSQVSFAPGSATLADSARGKLEHLASALKERPQLRLEIQGNAAATVDGLPLAEQRLEQALRDLWYQELQNRGERVPANASQLAVPETERPRLLAHLYQQQFKTEPGAGSEQQATMQQALLEHWAQRESLLRRLSQARAAAIKDYLVDQGGLDSERLYLIDGKLLEKVEDDSVPSQLSLESE